MLKCKVCGQEFTAKLDLHYISRDCGKVGVVAALQSNQEECIYDTFDCPACGCQCVAQERKRDFCSISISKIEDDDGPENVSGDEEKT